MKSVIVENWYARMSLDVLLSLALVQNFISWYIVMLRVSNRYIKDHIERNYANKIRKQRHA